MPSRKKSQWRPPRFTTCLLMGAMLFAPSGRFGAPLAGNTDIRASHNLHHMAQDEEDLPSDENEVPPQDVEKYIKVYKAMQQNRSLTVEQASAQQGLSVSTFRSLEDKIERNDALREHVRDALKPSPAATP